MAAIRTWHFSCIVLFIGLSGIAAWVDARPQATTPAGAGTMPDVLAQRVRGTPISSLPFTIDDCGVYFLTDCLAGVSGQPGILVMSDDVTIDLNGFALVGVPGSGDGIAIVDGHRNVTVEKGIIRDWDGGGIDADQTAGCAYRDLRIDGNAGDGIRTGTASLVEACTSNGSETGHGIYLGGDSIARACAAQSNAGRGIYAGAGCLVSRCVARGNTADGIAAQTSVVEGCAASSNTGDGIDASGSTLVRGCVAEGNGASQIDLNGTSQGIDNVP